MKNKILTLLFVFVFIGGIFAQPLYAFWMWNPTTGKWTNPKKGAKDTPEEQFKWAMEFYRTKDFKRSAEEFEKVPAVFPNSKLAAEAQYYMGICQEQLQDYGKAASAYQVLVDRYPYSERIEDAIEREFNIATLFLSGEKEKIIGLAILPATMRAREIFNHIIKSAPYGPYGDLAYYKLGESYKATGEYEEARKTFQALIDEYPNSRLADDARYQMAYTALRSSEQSKYSREITEKALSEFKDFKQSFPQSDRVSEANMVIDELKNKQARDTYEVGEFYEKRKKWKSASVYYQETVDRFPDTASAKEAQGKLEQLKDKIEE